VHDITIRYSTISHVGSGFTIGNGLSDSGALSQGAWNESIHDVIMTHVNAAPIMRRLSVSGSEWQRSKSASRCRHRPRHRHHRQPRGGHAGLRKPVNHPLTGFSWTNNIFTAGGSGIITTAEELELCIS